jgi:hypothetical protein
MQSLKIKEVPRNIVIGIIKRKFNIETTNEGSCILCGKEEVDTCSYCFFSTIEKILNELNFSEELMEDFHEIFNYQQTEDHLQKLENIRDFFEDIKNQEDEIRV